MLKRLKNIDWLGVGERVLKTFVEAFVAAVAASDIFNITDGHDLRSALISTAIAGISAGVAALWNLLSEFLKNGEKNES